MKTSLLSLLWLLPTLSGLAAYSLRERRVALTLATLAASLVTALGAAVFLSTATHTLDRWASFNALDGLGVDGLTAILLPVVGVLTLGGLLAMPRSALDPPAIAGALITAGATLGVLVSANVLVFAAFWAMSTVPFRVAAHRARDPVLVRSVRALEAVAVVPLCAAMIFAAALGARDHIPWFVDFTTLAASPGLRALSPYLAVVVVVSALARLGAFPFHPWVPVVLTRGPLAVSLPVVVSPIGSLALMRVLITLLPVGFLTVRPLLLVLGAGSMVYGSVLALGQHDARRQLGYVWVSAAGMVVLGIGTSDIHGMSGALLHEIAALLSVRGLFWVVIGVQARTGTGDMRRLGGLVRYAPWLATAYLLLGLATVGIPGTVSFVSEDLLVQGLLHRHPVSAVLLLVSAAVNGVTLVRSFKRIFLGPPSAYAPDFTHVEDMLPRERLVAVTVVFFLFAGGFAPSPALAVRAGVVSILHTRPSSALTDPAP